VFEKPQHPYAWGLLQSMPTVERKLEHLNAIEGSPPSLVAVPTGCPFHPRCAYRFARCIEELPELQPIPDGHPDRCHLTPAEKRANWAQREQARLGAAV
jgi:peptide/nickel transport system ATP-binding protein